MSPLNANSPEAVAALRALEDRRAAANVDALRFADEAIAGVRARGDAYVREQVLRLEGVDLKELLIEHGRPVAAAATQGSQRSTAPSVGAAALGRAASIIDPLLIEAIDTAIARVESFHRSQLPRSYQWIEGGTNVEHRVRPLRRVGLYVPGGRAVYLSTLIMTAVPARIAGVPEIVVATTPAAVERDELHYVCNRLGVRTIYQAGGAAAIAAMAIGTESLERVDKIAGPGNAYVTAAKSRLVGTVGIDMTAGPTELVVIADESANAAFVIADLAAQKEHGEDSSVICLTTSLSLARQIPGSALTLVVDSLDQAMTIANRIAPEHLSIQTRDARRLAERAENCGAIFCGDSSPVAAGDYIAGPNHVLPTAGSARFFSPLGVYDFVKRSNVITIDEEALRELAPLGQRLAEFEGLPMHARSLAERSVV